jgi:hypothetical protein
VTLLDAARSHLSAIALGVTLGILGRYGLAIEDGRTARRRDLVVDALIRAVMASAAMNAILDVNRAEDGSATADVHLVEYALAVVVAMPFEADRTIVTADDMRDAVERFAALVSTQLAAFREEHLRIGGCGWAAVPGRLQ